MAQSVLEYILRSKKEGTAAQDAAKDLDALEQQATKTSKSGELLAKGWQLAQGALIAGGVALIASVPALVDQGVAIERANTALVAYTGSNEEAEAAIKEVSAAAQGTLTDFEATQNATRLFSMGLATTAEEAGKLTKMAVTLGAAMGKDASGAFEDFSLMLANQSIPRLDTFGISGAAVRERMAELTEEIDGLDRQTAFMMATMEIGTQKLNELDAAGFQAGNSVDRLKAEVGNLKDSLATTIADGLLPWIDGIYAVRDGMKASHDEVINGSVSYADYLDKFQKLNEEHPILFNNTVKLTEAEWANLEVTAGLDAETAALADSAANADLIFQSYIGSSEELGGSLDDTKGSTDNLAASTDNLAISLNKVTEATLAREALDALKSAMDAGTISAEEYETMSYSVLRTLGGFTAAEAQTTVALAQLEADYESGKLTALEYYNAVNQLSGEINGIPNNVDVNINIKTNGVIPNIPGKKEGAPGIALQAGASWVVSGPPGIDEIPVSFMASRGERVTVTPQGINSGVGSGGGITINAQGAQFFGIGGVQQFADQLLPYLTRAERNA